MTQHHLCGLAFELRLDTVARGPIFDVESPYLRGSYGHRTDPCNRHDVALPLLPLRDVVVFPHMVIPLFVGRPKSIKALDVAMDAGKHILLVAQKSAAKDDPAAEDLYSIGSVATVLQMLKLPGRHRQSAGRGRAARAGRSRHRTKANTCRPDATALAGERRPGA